MNLIGRILRRCVTIALTTLILWLIVTQIFGRLDQRLPFFFALAFTYLISAYLILPQLIHISLLVSRRGRIPRVTHAADGIPADPVNIILLGDAKSLSAAFQTCGWYHADTLTLKTSLRMIKSFILNRPYPTAPFSSLYLFGRKQDISFQEPIHNSPRKRNHIRFWAANIDPTNKINIIKYWLRNDPVDLATSQIWVGAASKDTGFGLTSLTYQISHRIDKKIDTERDYIIESLRKNGVIYDEQYLDAGSSVGKKYISDGRIFVAKLR